MRLRLATIALPLLLSAALVATAIPASAGPTDAEQAFCDRYQEGITDSSVEDPSGAAAQGDFYRDLAEVAPTKSVKKNLKIVGKYFDKLEDIDVTDNEGINELFTTKLYTKYIKAAGKMSTYLANTCTFRIE